MSWKSQLAELDELAHAQCEGVLTDQQAERIEQLVTRNTELRRKYILYLQLHALAERGREIGSETETNPHAAAEHLEESAVAVSTFQLLSPIHAPVPPILSTPHRNTLGYLSSGWPMAYLIATVVVSIGIAIAAVTHVSQPEQKQLVQQSDSLPSSHAPLRTVVGQITGIVDCVWEGSKVRFQGSGENGQKAMKSPVALGDRLAISSGLLEITYNSGAKVILRGPVTYEVESAAGGYLEIGKLTARVEKENKKHPSPARGRGTGGEGGLNQNDSVQSAVPLFAVRTPMAIVIDLGTEFGIEVPERGETVVHVFEGKVDCRSLTRRGEVSETRHLTAGQTARVAAGKVAVGPNAASTPDFVRTIKTPRSMPTEVPRSQVLAYWRFEETVSSGNPDLKQPHAKRGPGGDVVQERVIQDSSGHGNHLNYNPCNEKWELGIGDYVGSNDVPPLSMFRPGYSGGAKAFNSGALDPKKNGVLFHSALQHGGVFDFQDSFTIEGYFKTDGDQSAVGLMTIVFKGPYLPVYLVSLNRELPGAVQFTLFDAAKHAVSVTAADRNFADGQWRYFAARLNSQKRAATLILIAPNGQTDRHSIGLPANFFLNWPNNDLFIGRTEHRLGMVEGHFRGLIDEIRICQGALADEQLLCTPAMQNK